MNAVGSSLASLRSSQTVVLGIICLGVFSTALDQTVVVAALPAVMVDLEIPLTDLDRASWIVTGYLISYTVAMPLAGRLSDVYGRIRMFHAALIVFSIGSAFVALAPNFEWVVSARVVSGLRRRRDGPHRPGHGRGSGVAGEEGNRDRARGSLGRSRFRPGASLWRSHHRVAGLAVDILLDIPQSLFLIALLAILPNRANPAARMDYFGALVLGAALTVLSIGLSQRAIFSGESIFPYLLVAGGVLLVLVLVVLERRAVQPLLASLPVHLQGVPVLQHHPVHGGGGPDHLAGIRAADGRHSHGERAWESAFTWSA